MATVEAQSVQYIIDPTPVDDEGILTLIELDSKHPDVSSSLSLLLSFLKTFLSVFSTSFSYTVDHSTEREREKRDVMFLHGDLALAFQQKRTKDLLVFKEKIDRIVNEIDRAYTQDRFLPKI